MMAEDSSEMNPDESADDPDRPTSDPENSAEVEESELPDGVVDEAERLTRLARERGGQEATAYSEARAELLGSHGFRARVREDDRAVLVLYPEEWVEDGTVRTERVDDTGRAVERPLEGPGGTDEWETIEAHNRELARVVEAEHGPEHGANAHALADFAGNHYAKPIEDVTGEELQEFLTEYYPRNAWPTDEQEALVEGSIRLVFECAGEPLPTGTVR